MHNPARIEPVAPKIDPQNDRRRRGRIRCEMLKSNLGEPVDLSGLGIRLVHVGLPSPRVGRSVRAKLKCKLGQLRVKARVRWVKKTGWRRQAVGLEFVNLSDSDKVHLSKISRFVGCSLIVNSHK